MERFEELLSQCMPVLERFIRFRVRERFDADDVLQEVCERAFVKRTELRSEEAFKPWLLTIARNAVNDLYRRTAKRMELPLEALEETALTSGPHGLTERLLVTDALERLPDKDRAILYLYYFRELTQEEIAGRLDIPIGTVKSRLHYAKEKFRDAYTDKEERNMKKNEVNEKTLPEILPEYKIERIDAPAFPVKWEEIMGWFIVPKLGERLSWAMYDFPERKRTERMEMEVIGRALIHGIEGVEIKTVEYEPMECNSAGGQDVVERRLVAQLTDTHCRMLAHSYTEDGVRRLYTFLDGDEFLDNWGFGEDNCGNETSIAPKGDIVREGSVVTTKDKKFLLDVVGRYSVTIGGKNYDTICVMDCFTYMEGEKVVSEQYLDRNGRTVLWRRFNHDEWAIDRYKKRWTELLPDNERLTVNGETYVHWYDCVTDYVL